MAVEALPSEAAVGRQDQLVRRDVLERLRIRSAITSGKSSWSVRWLTTPTAIFFLSESLVRREERELLEVVLGRLDRPDVALQPLEVDLHRVRVRLVGEHLLHHRVAPAGVDPDLDVVEPLDLAVEGVDEEVDGTPSSPGGSGR